MAEGRLPSSFRDPAGFVFIRNDTIYRQINRVCEEDWTCFKDSGLAAELVDAGLILPFESVGLEFALSDDAIDVIRPERVALITYPYEWGFSQLQDAALLTLSIMRRALGRGMWLKDASAYNVQFLGGKAVHIDTLSLERYPEGEAWIAYGQFCRHFLAPLALAAHVDIRLFGELRSHVDGIPLDLAARLLPGRTKFNFGLLTHLHLHGGAEKGGGGDSNRPMRPIPKTALLGLVDSLERTIRGLKWASKQSVWGDYYGNTNYTDAAFEAKKKLVAEYASAVSPRPTTCWDLGANTGVFSEIVADQGVPTWAWDYDPATVEQAYLRWRLAKRTDLTPLVQDFANPSPSLGWANEERDSFRERGPVDLILALALLHHLAIGNNVPLTEVAEWLHGLGKWAIVEFVPKDDSQVQRMLRRRRDVFTEYSIDGFLRAIEGWFDVRRKEPIAGTGRVLYLLEGKSL